MKDTAQRNGMMYVIDIVKYENRMDKKKAKKLIGGLRKQIKHRNESIYPKKNQSKRKKEKTTTSGKHNLTHTPVKSWLV